MVINTMDKPSPIRYTANEQLQQQPDNTTNKQILHPDVMDVKKIEEHLEKALKDGMDPNCRDHEGQTNLHVAASQNNKNIVKILLENKAHPNLPDDQQCTPLTIAVAQRRNSIASLILNNMMEQSINPSGFGDAINTPLHYALVFKNYPLAKQLIESKANPNAQDEGGDTPLHLLAMTGSHNQERKEIKKILIAAGANVNIRNDDGKTIATLQQEKRIRRRSNFYN